MMILMVMVRIQYCKQTFNKNILALNFSLWLSLELACIYFKSFIGSDNNTNHNGNDNHNDEATATAETADGRFVNVSVATDCQESLHEYQQQMEPSESVEGIEYRLWALRNDVEHDDELDESESSQQSRKKRKKKPCTDKIAVLA